MARERIERILARAIGLEPRSIGPAALEGALAARVRATRARDPGAYARLLERSREELAALIEEVVVSETWFFRGASAFRFLAEWIVERRRRAAGASEPARILSLPCATGEEPYSVVMALLEAGLPPAEVRVRAIDVSARAVEGARRGVFGPRSFRGPELGFRDRFFQRSGAGYRIHPRIQACVELEVANAVDPRLSLGKRCFDAILCRNLLIYLDPPSREKVLGRLEGALAAGGLLVTGHAEALPSMGARFQRARGPVSFAYVRAEGGPAADCARAARRGEPESPARPAAGRRAAPRQRRRPARSQRAPAWPETALEPAAGPSASDDLRGAQEACMRAIARGQADGDVYCLLGVALRGQGRIAEAEACLERALYLDRNHYQALVHLALLREANGDTSAATRLRRRAARAASAGARP